MVEKSSKEEDKEASHSTADYADYQPPSKEPSPIWRKLGIWGGVGAAVVILAAGGLWLAKNHKSAPKPASSATSQNGQANQKASASKISSATKHYDSTNFNLGFDYPADWTVSDTGNGQLTVKSPAIGLKDISGQRSDRQIVLSIRRGDQKLTEFDNGNSIAVLDSEKVAYTKPTQTQRANTYLSFLKYAGSDGLSGIYITGDNGYKKAQAIPKTDIQKVDPIISLTFFTFFKPDRTVPLGISVDNWNDDGFATPLRNLLQSFTIN